MTKNPIYNSLTAITYIVLLVFGMNYIFEKEVNNGILQYVTPIIMISLFTLSAAVMGYLFLYQPIMLYLDGKKEKAVKLFLQTVGVFGGIVLLLIVGYFIFLKLV